MTGGCSLSGSNQPARGQYPSPLSSLVIFFVVVVNLKYNSLTASCRLSTRWSCHCQTSCTLTYLHHQESDL